jgi:hypothetical protein
MKRDMDLIRKIMLAVEASESLDKPPSSIEGYSDDDVAAHAYLMKEAGLAEGPEITHLESPQRQAWATRLTWEGHEFLDLARNDTNWAKAKEKAGKAAGETTFTIWKAILVEIARQAVGL